MPSSDMRYERMNQQPHEPEVYLERALERNEALQVLWQIIMSLGPLPAKTVENTESPQPKNTNNVFSIEDYQKAIKAVDQAHKEVA